MTETKMLIGSLSNDLSRVATMIYRKSSSAEIFFYEMYRWIDALDITSLKPYIQAIINDLISQRGHPQFSQERAETYLMYSTLLQNYSLYIK